MCGENVMMQVMNKMHFVLSASVSMSRRTLSSDAGKKETHAERMKFVQQNWFDAFRIELICIHIAALLFFLNVAWMSAQSFVNASDKITNVFAIG